MNKITLASIIALVLSTPVLADNHGSLDKISSSFEELDNDSDGFISKEEADDDDIWEHFAKIDGVVDGTKDGEISRVEFNTYMENHVGEVAEDKEVAESAQNAKVQQFDPITSSFSDLDEDDNGYISVEEATGDRIDKHFGYMDADKDSRISESEFANYSVTHHADMHVSKNK